MKKKFLLIGPFPPPIGGDTIFNLSMSQSRYWEENGIELLKIDTSPRSGLRLPQDRLRLADILRGIKVFLIFLSKVHSVDCVMLWSNTRFVLTLGTFIINTCSFFRKPVAVWLFSTYFYERYKRVPSVWRRASRGALGRSTLIFCQTRLLSEILVEKLHLPEEKIVFFPNFVPDGYIVDSVGDKRFEGRCVFVGQIKREKGVFDIIEAIGRDERFSCDFYGPIHERDVEEFIRKVDGADNLSYRGTIEHGKVVETIRMYDLFLLPSFHPSEGYPAVVFESFAAGVPVLATDWLALREIVEDGERGVLVPIKSPDAIHEALERLLEDGELYMRISRNALDFAKSHSERRVINDILIARLKELL